MITDVITMKIEDMKCMHKVAARIDLFHSLAVMLSSVYIFYQMENLIQELVIFFCFIFLGPCNATGYPYTKTWWYHSSYVSLWLSSYTNLTFPTVTFPIEVW